MIRSDSDHGGGYPEIVEFFRPYQAERVSLRNSGPIDILFWETRHPATLSRMSGLTKRACDGLCRHCSVIPGIYYKKLIDEGTPSNNTLTLLHAIATDGSTLWENAPCSNDTCTIDFTHRGKRTAYLRILDRQQGGDRELKTPTSSTY
ncbi:hypothetical protein BKA82DRAFT_29772 [Pisolithus tinctorius]|uniref:Uncharacterized protein n=1 Tax=Pisolithus tinctorius Marx 270 TaxID=870435 RepID=A0A0C3ITB5_PISTI|nr:hypothetical protein BKA82DRAFT_29772 [Pisolithus tinctorius]KIO00153.1 hypothetical protein M404DRAFT_29772 [Pisolithus tinctorius Marx 270]